MFCAQEQYEYLRILSGCVFFIHPVVQTKNCLQNTVGLAVEQ